MIKLKYGNTDTFLIRGTGGSLLFDTDYAGTLPAFFKAIKQNGIKMRDIDYVMVSHYHPDHMGLVSELMRLGAKLLLTDSQKEFVHFSDKIFKRDGFEYEPIDEESAAVVSCEKSREFLFGLGISGEIIRTSSHSPCSVSLVLDGGECFVGDLEPFEHIGAYAEKTANEALSRDWELIRSFKPKTVYFAHRPAYSLQ